MANFLGWKDILRPIRDGYRHLFPTPDTGPTVEERLKQRELDRLKGFTYFDTFEQLEAWTEVDSDPLQRANTPLLQRSRTEAKGDSSEADVLMIHDYAGNYHEYENVQQVGIAEEMYSCEYLQYVDIFIYFSHKLACIPPPTWTNTLHRNGVQVLGTLLVEPQTQQSERLLQHTEKDGMMDFPIARKLAGIASHHDFDGWLVNIEKSFPKAEWKSYLMEMFLLQLKRELGEPRKVVWYDALTTSNKVAYQNGLNTSNLIFAKACGHMLTNYCWTEKDAETSRQLAVSNDIPLCNIFFGIDMWAQNTSSFTHPRVTFPEFGGGGTNTGVAVAKLAKLGLSAGIFAPAWTFEHFSGHGRAFERAAWEGIAPPNAIECTCGDCDTRHRPNKDFAITKYAKHNAAGSPSFFYTDFCRAFGGHSDQDKELFGGHDRHAQLGLQSILPCPNNGGDYDQESSVTSFRFEADSDRTTLVIEAQKSSMPSRGPTEASDQWLLLYKLDIPANDSLQLQVCYRTKLLSEDVNVFFVLQRACGNQLIPIKHMEGTQSIAEVISSNPAAAHDRVHGFGINVRGFAAGGGKTDILEILKILITPRFSHQSPQDCRISNIHIVYHGDEGNTQSRLCWESNHIDVTKVGETHKLPYSKITGPFSYFLVQINDMTLGRAYTFQYVIAQGLASKFKGEEVFVNIVGVGFDGRRIACEEARLYIS